MRINYCAAWTALAAEYYVDEISSLPEYRTEINFVVFILPLINGSVPSGLAVFNIRFHRNTQGLLPSEIISYKPVIGDEVYLWSDDPALTALFLLRLHCCGNRPVMVDLRRDEITKHLLSASNQEL